MAGYIGTKAAVVTPGAERKKVFSITTTTTSLTGLAYTPGFVHVFHNGVRLVDGTDYTATNGTSLTLTTAAQNGDEVVVISYATFEVADAYTKAESDDRYVNVTGDTMTGALAVNGNLTVDTDTLFVDAANNRVGVGTISPVAPLHVAGASRFVSGGATTPAITVTQGYINGDINSANFSIGNFGDGSSEMRVGTRGFTTFFTGAFDNATGTERMRIDSSGNVGIGGSVDNHGGYSRCLQVTGTEAALELESSSGYSYVAQNGTSLQIRNVANGDMPFYTNNTERMRIDSAGRVTMPYQPAFGARLTSNLGTGLTGGPIAIATVNGVTITVDTNVGSHYNPAVGVFTAPVAGQYYAFMQNLTYSGSGYIQAGISVNGVLRTFGYNDSTANVLYDVEFVAAVISLAASDQVRFEIHFKSTSDSFLHSGNYNTMGCYLIG